MALQVRVPVASDIVCSTTSCPYNLFILPSSHGPLGVDFVLVKKTAAGPHAFAQLWSLLGRQLDRELRPETEALHVVRKVTRKASAVVRLQNRAGLMPAADFDSLARGT